MGQDRRNYLRLRAAEELAAAKRATSAGAMSAHRELSLRYALALILPEREVADDDARPVGQPRAVAQTPAALPLPGVEGERRRG